MRKVPVTVLERATFAVGLLWALPLLGQAPAKASPLQAGPMLGYVQLREAAIWLQTRGPAEVYLTYYDSAAPKTLLQTPVVRTTAAQAHTAKFILGPLEPGRLYFYTVYVNKKPVVLPYPTRFRTLPLWKWRASPPDFQFVIGSCAYINDPPYDRPGQPYGGEYEIFKRIMEVKPDFMLWLGDNVYLREADWNSRTGILYRYTHTRSLSELQPLLAYCPHYATWDDHDFGPNDADRGFWYRNASREAFTLFWANPSFGVPAVPDGITTFFEWGDAEFFLLDNRTFRAPNKRTTGDRSYFGQAQLEWLIDALRSSRATFKFVVCGGQVLNPTEGFENMIGYRAERETLLKRLTEERISGVVFLNGDRHFSEMSRYQLSNGQWLYEITSSPLTASPFAEAEKREKNPYRLEGTLTPKRNFILIRVEGPERERTLRFACYDSQGSLQWERTVAAKELRPGRD